MKMRTIIAIITTLLALYFTASYYLYSQASNILYEYQHSKNLTYTVPTEHASVTNSSGDQLDILTTKNPGSQTHFLYLHGTWGRLPYIINDLTRYGSVWTVAYPGYSESTGTSNTAKVNEAAEIALSQMNKAGIPNSSIVVLGHSLGGSPALLLAGKHADLKQVITVNTFYSMQKRCQREYSVLCIFTRGVHPSNIYARTTKAPVLILHSKDDTGIPYQDSEELEKIISSPIHSFKLITGAHETIPVDLIMKHAGVSSVPTVE